MAQLSEPAAHVLSYARDMKLIDETVSQQLQQIFCHRVDTLLVQSLIVGREQQLAKDLFRIIATLHAVDTLGYVLRFIADVTQLCPSLLTAFAKPSDPTAFATDPVSHFGHLATTNRTELGVFNPAIVLFAGGIALATDLEKRTADVKSFLVIVKAALDLPELIDPAIEYVIPAMCYFLRRPELRPAFAELGVAHQLTRLLTQCLERENATIVQLTYETLWAMRLCTFDYGLLATLQSNRLLPVVHRALQRSTKEKVIRMSLHVIKNVMFAQDQYGRMQKGEVVAPSVQPLTACNRGRGPQMYSEMIGMGVLKTTTQLMRKNFGDADVPALLEEVVRSLEKNIDDVTSFSEYLGEVHSGLLEWSAAHTSTKFWKENAKHIEANEFAVVRDLGALLLSSTNELTLAVACHDIGEIIRHHPTGRLILTIPSMKGIKERVISLMQNANVEVAKHALTAVQKMLILKWDR